MIICTFEDQSINMHLKRYIILLLLVVFIQYVGSANCSYTHQKDSILQEQANPEDELFTSALFELENGEQGAAYADFVSYLNCVRIQNNNSAIVEALYHVGTIYKEMQVWDIALQFFFEAIEVSNEPYTAVTGEVLASVGGIYYDREDFHQALQYYQKSLQVFRRNSTSREVAAAMNNIGECHRFHGNADSALYYYQAAVDMNKNQQNHLFLAINYNNIGTVLLGQSKYETSYTYLNESRIILEKEGHTELIAASYSSLGDYYMATGMVAKAIENYRKTLAFNKFSYAKKEFIESDAWMGLSAAYDHIGDDKNALNALRRYHEVRKSIDAATMDKAVFEIETRFETKQKEQEIQALKEQSAIDQEAKRKQLVRSVIIIVMLLLIVALLIYSYLLQSRSIRNKTLLYKQQEKVNQLELDKKNLENQRLQAENRDLEARGEIEVMKREALEQELQFKERELSTSAMHVVGKNEMLSGLKSAMQQLLENDNADPQQILRELVRTIDQNINLDKDWDTFKLHFEKVHPGFFMRLKEHYPDLTVDELKLCAYLRINLSSKEIAQILNITPVAINKRRNRLRKKIDLDTSDDLFMFMSRI